MKNKPVAPCASDVDSGPSRLEITGDQKRGYAMGDKSKKDKEKGQKQNVAKQKEKADKKTDKQPKRAS